MALLVPVIKSNYSLYGSSPVGVKGGYPTPSCSETTKQRVGIAKSASYKNASINNNHDTNNHINRERPRYPINIFATQDPELQKKLTNDYYKNYYYHSNQHKSSSSSGSLSEGGSNGTCAPLIKPQLPIPTFSKNLSTQRAYYAHYLKSVPKPNNYGYTAGKGQLLLSKNTNKNNNGTTYSPTTIILNHPVYGITNTSLSIPTLIVSNNLSTAAAPVTAGRRFRSLSERSRIITPMPIIFENETLGSGPEMLFHPHTAPPVRKTRVTRKKSKPSKHDQTDATERKKTIKLASATSTTKSSTEQCTNQIRKSLRQRFTLLTTNHSIVNESQQTLPNNNGPKRWYSFLLSSPSSTSTPSSTSPSATSSTNPQENLTATSVNFDVTLKTPKSTVNTLKDNNICQCKQICKCPCHSILKNETTNISDTESHSTTTITPRPDRFKYIPCHDLDRSADLLDLIKSNQHTPNQVDDNNGNKRDKETTKTKPIDIIDKRKDLIDSLSTPPSSFSDIESSGGFTSPYTPSPPSLKLDDTTTTSSLNAQINSKAKCDKSSLKLNLSGTIPTTEIALAGKYGFVQLTRRHNKLYLKRSSQRSAHVKDSSNRNLKMPSQSSDLQDNSTPSNVSSIEGSTFSNNVSCLFKTLSDKLSSVSHSSSPASSSRVSINSKISKIQKKERGLHKIHISGEETSSATNINQEEPSSPSSTCTTINNDEDSNSPLLLSSQESLTNTNFRPLSGTDDDSDFKNKDLNFSQQTSNGPNNIIHQPCVCLTSNDLTLTSSSAAINHHNIQNPVTVLPLEQSESFVYQNSSTLNDEDDSSDSPRTSNLTLSDIFTAPSCDTCKTALSVPFGIITSTYNSSSSTNNAFLKKTGSSLSATSSNSTSSYRSAIDCNGGINNIDSVDILSASAKSLPIVSSPKEKMSQLSDNLVKCYDVNIIRSVPQLTTSAASNKFDTPPLPLNQVESLDNNNSLNNSSTQCSPAKKFLHLPSKFNIFRRRIRTISS